MKGGKHSHREVTVFVKVPCPECGGRGYVETLREGHIVADTTDECLICAGDGVVPEDMPLTRFREMLKASSAGRFSKRS